MSGGGEEGKNEIGTSKTFFGAGNSLSKVNITRSNEKEPILT